MCVKLTRLIAQRITTTAVSCFMTEWCVQSLLKCRQVLSKDSISSSRFTGVNSTEIKELSLLDHAGATAGSRSKHPAESLLKEYSIQ
jgi:hypothetical protein